MDAFIPQHLFPSITNNNSLIGFSYDINTSTYATASNGNDRLNFRWCIKFADRNVAAYTARNF